VGRKTPDFLSWIATFRNKEGNADKVSHKNAEKPMALFGTKNVQLFTEMCIKPQ
jgi:hypothetical protein